LRVALVTTFYPPLNFGGDGRYVRSLAHALARRGIEVDVVHDADAWRVLRPAGMPEPAAETEPPGVTVHRLHSGWPLGATFLTYTTGRPLLRANPLRRLLERDFDVIHFHNVSLIGGPGVLGLGDAIKLYTAHEHWLVCPTHVLWRHGRELCTARECLRCTLVHGRPPQPWRATGLLEREIRHVDEFIALSHSVAENHRRFGFAREMKVMGSFLPSGSENHVPQRRRHDRPYFLFVGRLESIKGLQDVIPQFDADSPADLLIAGEGSFEPQLRALAAARPSVHFLGRQDLAQLRPLYRDAVALVAPSLCYEVFPMVVLEAFREGTPVIARDLGPYPQILGESGGGLLFTDAASLRSALFTLLHDHALRDRMGAGGQRAGESRWSEQAAVDAWLALVREIAVRRERTATLARLDRMDNDARAAAPALPVELL
jgi:glycosyltransferase involved in cell wall biosynthesis